MSKKDDQIFTKEDEIAFKKAYIINFLAAYDVQHYQENCYRGWKNRNGPPVEDAKCMADYAWDQWVELVGFPDDST